MEINNKQTYVKRIRDDIGDELKEIERLAELDDPYSDESYSEPLSIETFIEKKILLSWGGPEDGYKLTFSEGKELLRGVYYRADWGEYKEIQLTDDEADLVYNFYLGGCIE